jgi:hypothetical protein
MKHGHVMRITKTFLVFSAILALSSTSMVLASSTGPDPGVNGVFGAAINCTMCHDSFPLNSGTGSVTITGLPGSWVPGQTYSLTVTVGAAIGSSRYGFQLSAVADGTNQQAGTLTKVNSAVQVVCSPSAGEIYPGTSCNAPGAIQFAEHTNATGVATFLVNWTAPGSPGVGTVRFNVAGNSANGNFDSSGDHIYTRAYLVAPLDPSVHAFTMVDRGGNSVITDGSGNLTAGYARILVSSGTTPSGVAIFGERIGGVLVTEAGVPASALIHNGRIYAEVGAAGFSGQGTDIGLAIANPSISQSATISFSYTSAAGMDIPGGTYNLAPGAQLASFLDQAPWNAPLGFQGTFSFSSDVPISVVALEGFRNERNEFLITTLPVIDTSATPLTTTVVLPHFTDGAGWSTYILLVNPTDTAMTGTIQFRDANGNVQSLTANGQTANSFGYSVPPRSSFKLTTAGAGSFKSGSVSVTPASGNNSPVSLAVFSFAAGGVTVTQAGVPSNAATGFRMFVEGVPGRPSATIGSYSSGFAVANASSSSATVAFNLYTLAGASTGLTKTVQLGPFGQVAQFLEDVFPALQLPFQGILEITTSSSAISVVGLRIRYNERDEFLMTTTPPTDESSSTTTTESDFPHILNGGGFTTQFILFSGSSGQSATGKLEFHKQDGSSFNLNVN